MGTRARHPATLAVQSLRRWWNSVGVLGYPDADAQLVTADSGGSNSCRTRAWKADFAELALETGLRITVCSFPPGTSKWNAIEHRLFSHLSMNWRGQPLTATRSSSTRSRGALPVPGCACTPNSTPTPTQPPPPSATPQLAGLPITPPRLARRDWNYTLRPDQPDPDRAAAPSGRPEMDRALADPSRGNRSTTGRVRGVDNRITAAAYNAKP